MTATLEKNLINENNIDLEVLDVVMNHDFSLLLVCLMMLPKL